MLNTGKNLKIFVSKGLNVKVVPSNFKEDLDKATFKSPIDYVVEYSRLKALDVVEGIKSRDDWLFLVGADTVVVVDGRIHEKPSDREDAFKIIKSLSSRSHMVYTGVTLVKKTSTDLKWHSFYEGTEVTMAELSDDVIRAYVDTGEPLDKAGAYGIQDLGATLVKSIKGDFFNVEGFPAHRFAIELTKFLVD